jgi:hypothetical protein
MSLDKLYHWGDKLEDRVRSFLSRYPIFYSLISGAAVVIFWRGVWHSWDYISWSLGFYEGPLSLWDGPLAILVGTIILLVTGILVSEFIGEQIIISGLKGEKKIVDKTKEELAEEEDLLRQIKNKIDKIEKKLEEKTQ